MSIKSIVKNYLRNKLTPFLESEGYQRNEFSHLDKAVLEINNVEELKKIFHWDLDPVLDNPKLYDYKFIEDLNQRRQHDAEAIGIIARNISPHICVDIGTALGYSAALLGINAPSSTIYTVNILPEDIDSGAGGVLTTKAFSKEQIGRYHRERGLENVVQIFANTAIWEPDFDLIDMAFIDGSHDTEFVYNDTKKIISRMKPGSFILWHDFCPELVKKYDWLYSVCLGVERLFNDGILRGHILHLRDSWVGIYRVE